MNGRNPISNKVSNGTTSGVIAGVVASLLQAYIPAFHNGVPPVVNLLITVGLAAAGYFVGGYASKHQATVSEIKTAVSDAEQVIAAVAPSTPGATVA